MRNRNLLVGGLIALVLGIAGMAWGPGIDGGWGGWDHGSMMRGGGMMWGWDDDTSAAAAIPGAPTIDVTAFDLGFDPDRIEVPAGETFNLRLVNDGRVFHDLTIDNLDFRIGANPGRTSTGGFEGLEAGEYSFECSVPGHAAAGMVGVLVVTG